MDKRYNYHISSDGEIFVPNYFLMALPHITVRIESAGTTYRFTGSYDGSHSLTSKLLDHMGKESEKESETGGIQDEV